MTKVLTVTAPAKINLTLEVLGKRPDGYHEIRSVLQTIDLCDTLSLEAGQGRDFPVRYAGMVGGEKPVKPDDKPVTKSYRMYQRG